MDYIYGGSDCKSWFRRRRKSIVCVCVGIYFDVYASKCVPGGEQEVGLATRTRRITGSPSQLENTYIYIYGIYIFFPFLFHIYMWNIYTHTPHIHIFHIYIPYIYTHTQKENIYIYVCVYMHVFFYLNDLWLPDYCF